MKRLLGLLLVMGMVGCGGGNSHERGTASSNQPPAQAVNVDPVAELENLGA